MAFKLKSQTSSNGEEKTPSKAYQKATRPFYSLANRAESKVEQLLDYPMLKANKKVEDYNKKHSGNFDKVDAVRHGAASMYTRKAISKKLGGGILGDVAGVVGSNILGAGHELSALNTDHGYKNGIIEAGKDMANNFIGSVSSEKNLESNLKKYGNSGMSEATRNERLSDLRNEQMQSSIRNQSIDVINTKKKAQELGVKSNLLNKKK
jgi:hypothetical protein